MGFNKNQTIGYYRQELLRFADIAFFEDEIKAISRSIVGNEPERLFVEEQAGSDDVFKEIIADYKDTGTLIIIPSLEHVKATGSMLEQTVDQSLAIIPIDECATTSAMELGDVVKLALKTHRHLYSAYEAHRNYQETEQRKAQSNRRKRETERFSAHITPIIEELIRNGATTPASIKKELEVLRQTKGGADKYATPSDKKFGEPASDRTEWTTTTIDRMIFGYKRGGKSGFTVTIGNFKLQRALYETLGKPPVQFERCWREKIPTYISENGEIAQLDD
jgi:predicted DNA binding protein